MKRYITFSNIIFFILSVFLFNSYLLIKKIPYLLLLIIPLFILLNILPGIKLNGTKKLRLKFCHHGTATLFIFILSLIPSIIWHVVLAFRLLPQNYLDFIFSALLCIIFSAIFFWNGILCVYLTSTQMGIKWRVIGALCGMIPIANLIVLTKIIRVTADELDFEIKKEIILHFNNKKVMRMFY